MSFIKVPTPQGMCYIRAEDVEMVTDYDEDTSYVQVKGNVVRLPGKADDILIDVMRALLDDRAFSQVRTVEPPF